MNSLMNTREVEQRSLEVIVGEELNSVVFVMDYVQLTFNGPILNAVTCPDVLVGKQVFHWNESGYRDALCAQITHTVKSVEIRQGQEVTILFTNNVTIRISLRDVDYRGAEAVQFSDGPHWWAI